jgi:hypothetical protein
MFDDAGPYRNKVHSQYSAFNDWIEKIDQAFTNDPRDHYVLPTFRGNVTQFDPNYFLDPLTTPHTFAI